MFVVPAVYLLMRRPRVEREPGERWWRKRHAPA
jgi:hypothetical protein